MLGRFTAPAEHTVPISTLRIPFDFCGSVDIAADVAK